MSVMDQPKLDKPGAGLPPLEWAVAKFVIVPRYLRKTTAQQALNKAEDQAASILQIARSLSPEKVATQVLIPRLPGLEDSSRYWSVAMVVEHLTIVNRGIGRAVAALSQGVVPEGKASTAAVKPSPDVVASAILNEYEQSIGKLLAELRATDVERFPNAKYAHPWFGPLNAREWLLFIPFHQRVHMKQIDEITKRLGE